MEGRQILHLIIPSSVPPQIFQFNKCFRGCRTLDHDSPLGLCRQDSERLEIAYGVRHLTIGWFIHRANDSFMVSPSTF